MAFFASDPSAEEGDWQSPNRVPVVRGKPVHARLETDPKLLRENPLSRNVLSLILYASLPLVIVAGMWGTSDYSFRPGDVGMPPREMRVAELERLFTRGDSVPVELAPSKSTLIVCVHPHCPCTTASVRMLKRILPGLAVRPNLIALAYCPPSLPDDWIDSSITRELRQIPGMSVFVDRSGGKSTQLGVKTSGHFLIYEPDDGQLVFSGGITPGRAHEGDCPASADLAAKSEGLVEFRQWPVFGCSIVFREELNP